MNDLANEASSFEGFERLLVVPRAVIGALGLPLLAILSPSTWPMGLILCGSVLLITSALSHHTLKQQPNMLAMRRLCMRTTALDLVVAVMAWALLSTTDAAPGAILLPLVAFEMALKNGLLGAAGGSSVVLIGVLGRMWMRHGAFGLAPRPGLVAVVLGTAGLLVGLALTIRSQQLAHRLVVAEKQRIRTAFKDAVEAALANVGVDKATLAAGNFERLLDMACDRNDVGAELGRQLVSLLAPPSQLSTLTRRETEVFNLLAGGLSDAEIAARLYVARVTVRVHVSNILRKLEVATRDEALLLMNRQAEHSESEHFEFPFNGPQETTLDTLPTVGSSVDLTGTFAGLTPTKPPTADSKIRSVMAQEQSATAAAGAS